jgi:hypothetical protein
MIDLGKIDFLKGGSRYQRAPEKTISVQIPLSGKEKEIDEYQRNLSLNLAEVYDIERQASILFEPTCKFQVIFSNTYSGVASSGGVIYKPYNNFLYYLNPETTKVEQVNSVAEIPWPGFPQYNEFNFIRRDIGVQNYTLSPSEHQVLKSEMASNYNWNFYLSYPYSNNYDRILSYDFETSLGPISWTPSQGIPATMKQILIEGKTFWQLTCALKHNLRAGQFVEFSNINIVNSSGDISPNTKIFEIYSLGNGFFNSEETIFNILDIGYFQNPVKSFFPDKLTFFHKVLNKDNPTESKSKYYIRQHKIITDYSESIVTNSGFDQNMFRTTKKFESRELTPNLRSRISIKEDSQSYNLSFKNTIELSGLTDNLKRPITEIYTTVINRGYFGFFNPKNINGKALKVGWGFNITPEPTTWWERDQPNSDVDLGTNFYTKSGKKFYYNKFLNVGDVLDGPFCEWNNITQTETILSEVYHKFVYNPETFNINSSLSNPFGFYYEPFHKFKLRVYSDYIEEGSLETAEFFPKYSYYSSFEKKLLWRDLYTYGYVDSDNIGVNYPFFNGRHYPYENFIFRIIPEGTNIKNVLETQDPIVDGCE